MNRKIVRIKEGENYITLNVLLKLTNIISTGGEAKYYLQENEVLVNDILENRRGRKLYPGDVIKVEGKEFEIN
ncbi:MAG: S4 domain-containing protein YaaA [Clostridia bacterium]|nr:S4 domain-containing protein YaaA [Clostridia bacterium]